MGYYIQGPNRGKTEMLIEKYGAKILAPLDVPFSYSEIPEDKALVVVIDNFAFDAAALCYSSREFEDLVNFDIIEDPRLRKILIMDKAKAYELAGYHG